MEYNDITYLNVSDLQEMTSISKNVDPQFLVPYIRSGELMFVSDALGTALDTTLKNQLTGNTLTDENKILVQNYIKPLSAWSAFLEAVPFISFKFTNKGVQRQNSEYSEVPAVADLTWYRQNVKDKQSFYRNRLVEYLDCNTTLYPDYRCKPTPKFSNGIYLGKSDRSKTNY
jgi:hypothetical protein